MPLVPNALGYRQGIAKQTNESTPVATADALWVPWSGEVTAMHDMQPMQVADINNMRPAFYKKSAHWEANLQIGVFAETFGAVMKSMLGSDSVTGAGPFTHKIAMADPNNDFIQLWQLRPDGTGPGLGLWERYESGKFDSVEIVWAPGDPLKANITAKGKTVTVATAPTLTNTIVDGYQTNAFLYNAGVATAYPSAAASPVSNDFITSIGPTLKLDFGAASNSTTVTYLESGSLKITRELEMIQTGLLTPTYPKQGLVDVALSFTALWESYTQYRNSYFGGNTGTGFSGTINVGAIDLKFLSMQGATRSLQFQVPNQTAGIGAGVGTTGSLSFQFDPPAVDPNGGAVRLTGTGYFSKTASGDSIGCVAVNDISGAYS